MSQGKDVHTEHCCKKHGCKYGDDNCPVVSGLKKQSFPCDMCDDEGETQTMREKILERLKEIKEEENGFVGSARWKNVNDRFVIKGLLSDIDFDKLQDETLIRIFEVVIRQRSRGY